MLVDYDSEHVDPAEEPEPTKRARLKLEKVVRDAKLDAALGHVSGS